MALVAAAQAGRPGEDGSGAMWIAPELVPPTAIAEPCVHRGTPTGRNLVFEVIRLDDDRQMPARAGGAVAFEWNAATGELSIAGNGAADPAAIRNSGWMIGLSGRCGA